MTEGDSHEVCIGSKSFIAEQINDMPNKANLPDAVALKKATANIINNDQGAFGEDENVNDIGWFLDKTDGQVIAFGFSEQLLHDAVKAVKMLDDMGIRVCVEEKFRKYFGYLARCEGKICI